MLVRSEFALTHYELPLLRLDGILYLQVAQGNHQNISSPFSRRVLYPGLARVLSMATGASLRYTFYFLSILSFSLLAYSLAWIFTIFGLSPWLIAVCLLTPFPIVGLEMGYMPDLFSAALTALCFLFLLQERHLLALVTLAICFPARENTLIVCVILGVIAWLRNQPKLAGGALLVIILGSALGTWFVHLGSPNIHHLPDFAYLLFKAPHQFLKNVLGIRIWVNTLPVGNPWIKFALPPTLCWGAVREVGICPFEWSFPAYTSLTLLIIFGTMPVLLWKARHLRLWSNRYPLAIQVATWTERSDICSEPPLATRSTGSSAMAGPCSGLWVRMSLRISSEMKTGKVSPGFTSFSSPLPGFPKSRSTRDGRAAIFPSSC